MASTSPPRTLQDAAIGLATVRVVSAADGGRAAALADDGDLTAVYVYTHFGRDTYDALTFAATDGDRCWRLEGERACRNEGGFEGRGRDAKQKNKNSMDA